MSASRKEEALWLLERLLTASGINNLSFAFRTPHGLKLPALREALRALLVRYEQLRTVFRAEGAGLVKEVLPADEALIDLERRPSSPGRLDAELTAFVAEPFTFDGRLLLRAGVFHSGEYDVCCVAVHHMIFDATSGTVLQEELVSAYNALVSKGRLPEELTSEVGILAETLPKPESIAFWRQQLRGARPDELSLSCGNADVPHATLAGGQVTRPLSHAAQDAVRRLEKELRAPRAVVLLAAYYLLLDAHGAGPDLIVGAPINVRPPTAQRAIGYHVNVIPLRMQLDGEETCRAFVRRTRDAFFAAIAHADVPVDDLLSEIPRQGSNWRHTLFRHVFNYLPDRNVRDFTVGGQPAQSVLVENGYSKFDLELFLIPGPEGISVRAVHYTEVLSRADVEAMVARYDALLVALGDDFERRVGEVPFWSERDRAVIDASNRTTRTVEWPTVLSAIAATVTARPDAVAVVDGARQITYRQLWAAAAATRDALAKASVGSGDAVAVLAPRGPELAAAVLGVWLAGAAYLPLDPEHPEQRIAYQLEDARAKAVLAGSGIAAASGHTVLPLASVDRAEQADVRGAENIGAETCAYLIYTSGSTGRPKGVRVSHASLANLITHFVGELGATASHSTLWMTTFSFDISALELFLPLVSGGRLVIAPDEARAKGQSLLELIRRSDVDIIQATPTTWRLVVGEVGDALAGRTVLCGGEPLPPPLARRLAATGCVLRNVYGPTETTIWSTSGKIENDIGDSLDVGKPISNTRLFVADPRGRALPLGVRGELCIAGNGVAMGYHERPELTAARFGEHPIYGRFYRTGDVARWASNGAIELYGRADRQIKLWGQRIELGEIECVLQSHPRVNAAAVVVARGSDGSPRLVAFVEAPDQPGMIETLWEHARAELPRAAVPQQFVTIDALPKSPAGKIDYPTLVELADERRSPAGDEAETIEDDPLVANVVTIYRELLQKPNVNAGTNFFLNGGHSVLGALLVQKIEETLGQRIKLTDVFDHPTPAAIAARLRRK